MATVGLREEVPRAAGGPAGRGVLCRQAGRVGLSTSPGMRAIRARRRWEPTGSYWRVHSFRIVRSPPSATPSVRKRLVRVAPATLPGGRRSGVGPPVPSTSRARHHLWTRPPHAAASVSHQGEGHPTISVGSLLPSRSISATWCGMSTAEAVDRVCPRRSTHFVFVHRRDGMEDGAWNSLRAPSAW